MLHGAGKLRRQQSVRFLGKLFLGRFQTPEWDEKIKRIILFG